MIMTDGSSWVADECALALPLVRGAAVGIKRAPALALVCGR